MMARKREAWTLVTPLAYRRPRRPGRRVALVATGLALSTVVAGLAVLGSIHPTPQSATAHAPGPSPSATTARAVTSTVTLPASPTETRGPAAYTEPRQGTSVGGGYVAPSLTPTDPPPPPTQTSTDGNLTYTMTYDSGTVVVVYPSGDYPAGDGGGGGRHGGGHH